MNSNQYLIYCFYFSFLLFFTFACQSNQEQVEEEDIIPEEELISTETDIKLDLVINDMPSPIDLTAQISATGAPINKSILNSPRNASNYATNYQKSLNLGIYVADLGYVTAYEQVQDATGYLRSVKELSDDLHISGAYDRKFIEKFEQYINNNDSLRDLLKQGYAKVDKFLRSNERVSTATLVLAGGWVETLYITTQIIQDEERNDKNDILYLNVGDQKFSLNNLLDLLDLYNKSADHNKLIMELNELKTYYSGINQSHKIRLNHIQKIREYITRIRNNITGS